MSEKRFTIKISDSGNYDIYDNLKQEYFIADSSLPVNSFAEEIVDLLNEQDKTIKNQEQRIKILQQEIQSAQQIGVLLSERLKGFCGDGV